MLEIAKHKIDLLLKILKNFVDRNRAGINIEKEIPKKSKIADKCEDEMIVDEDDLEYTKKSRNLENVIKFKETSKKKKGIPLYEIK